MTTVDIGPSEVVDAEVVAPQSEELGLPDPPDDDIRARIRRVIASLPHFGKERQFGEEGGRGVNYRFRSIEDMLPEIRAALVREGIIVVPSVRLADSVTYEVVNNTRTTRWRHVTVDGRYTFRAVGMDPAGESVEVSVVAEAKDSSDKALAKATTAAKKAALVELFLIGGEPDPDEEHPDDSSERGASSAPSGRTRGQRSSARRESAQRSRRPIEHLIELRDRLKAANLYEDTCAYAAGIGVDLIPATDDAAVQQVLDYARDLLGKAQGGAEGGQ